MLLVWLSLPVFDGAPLAEAEALASLCDDPSAANSMPPPAVILRSVRALTAWLARVRASATPTEALDPPDAEPSEVVAVEVRWLAIAVRDPSISMRLSSARAAMSTLVVTSEEVTAMAGATAALPPPLTAAPMRASVSASTRAVAVIVRSWAPLRIASGAMTALVSSPMRLRANETPTPTSPVEVLPVPTGSAVTVETSEDAASMSASPPFSSTVPSTAAFVCWLTTAIATEPATETPPAAPAAAAAETVETSSAPTFVTVAETTSDPASIVSQAGTIARLSTLETVTATPAPIAAVVPSVAEPSAALAASLLALEARVTAPPALIEVTSVVITVCATTVEMATPMAAATVTRPSEVSAFGASALPVPEPPCLPETRFA